MLDVIGEIEVPIPTQDAVVDACKARRRGRGAGARDGPVRITFTVDAAGFVVNTIRPLFAGNHARSQEAISWAY